MITIGGTNDQVIIFESCMSQDQLVPSQVPNKVAVITGSITHLQT